MIKPLVSCIMPTANRRKYIPFAIKHFLAQDYPNAELIIVDDGSDSCADLVPDVGNIRYLYSTPMGSVGLKRNHACEVANGEIILHWDDDDWYAHDWISRQVDALLKTGADMTGLNRVVFFSPALNKKWIYEDHDTEKPWLCGATLAYPKSFWQQHPFIDVHVGEDYDFVWNTGARIQAHDYFEGFIALLHDHNTSLKPIENPKHKKNAKAWVEPLPPGQTPKDA